MYGAIFRAWITKSCITNDAVKHARTVKDALAKTKLGAWEYDIIGTYYKCNMTDIMAAVGLVQFARYPKLLARRKEIIERYNKGLAKLPVEALTHFDDTVTSSGHLYLVRLTGKGEEYRNDMITRMGGKRCGMQCPLQAAANAYGI